MSNQQAEKLQFDTVANSKLGLQHFNNYIMQIINYINKYLMDETLFSG